ncbi:MAG: aminotransferase class V-fold PLP-dependent enzyme [Ethanoligenens sp.]
MIYFDNAATSFPKPPQVGAAVSRFIRETGANPGRSGHKLSMEAAETVYACRKAISSYFHAPGVECVSFTLNATYAINFALKGVLARRGRAAHVVTSNLEHNAVMRPLHKLQIPYTAAVVDLADDVRTLQNFEAALRPDTALVACTHASNLCGRVLPIADIGALCHEKGIPFLVDASQSAGMLPIDMQACHIDYLCMPGHKSLYGPMGTGILIAVNGEALETLIEGGTGSNSVDLEQPALMPDRFESGTVNAPGIAGLHAGVRFARARGQESYVKEMRMARMLYDGLHQIPGVRLYTPRPFNNGYVPVVSFNIGERSSVEVTAKLDKMGFALRGGLHCAPVAHLAFGTINQGMVRASIGAFNTPDHIAALLSAAKKIAAE